MGEDISTKKEQQTEEKRFTQEEVDEIVEKTDSEENAENKGKTWKRALPCVN